MGSCGDTHSTAGSDKQRLFLRLFASDLFIHGIGGGIYDRLTDAWMQRLFNVAPPIYLTTTATIHLPGFEQLTAQRALQTIHQQQRDLRFHHPSDSLLCLA